MLRAAFLLQAYESLSVGLEKTSNQSRKGTNIHQRDENNVSNTKSSKEASLRVFLLVHG